MDLEIFIRESLVDIHKAITEANIEIGEKFFSLDEKDGQAHIEFDIAVLPKSESGIISGKSKITVLGACKDSEKINASHIKFDVRLANK